jgi:hypothetical protein
LSLQRKIFNLLKELRQTEFDLVLDKASIPKSILRYGVNLHEHALDVSGYTSNWEISVLDRLIFIIYEVAPRLRS